MSIIGRFSPLGTTQLILQRNLLEAIPASLNKLRKLQQLDLSFNYIASLPPLELPVRTHLARIALYFSVPCTVSRVAHHNVHVGAMKRNR